MLQQLAGAAYAIGQGARIGLYWGQYVVTNRMTRPPADSPPVEGPFPNRSEIMADLRDLLRRDWHNIAAGHYRLPQDLVSGPLAALARAPGYFSDLRAVERRRHRRGHDEVYRAAETGATDRYPRYYLQNFHFQTDGWLSDHSARLYDHQVEVLFTGGADAMRRQALVPLAEHIRGRRQADLRLLDLASGTGRFLGFVKDAFPRLPVTALDLSAPYLEAARDLLRPWRDVDYVQAPAEATGLPAESFDLVTCIFLLHELPPKVRPLVAQEAARLQRPGGRLVLVDSIQKGDKPSYDALLDQFPVSFHEPYYGSYVRTDLEELFGAAGLRLESSERAFFAKVVVLRKPA